MNSKLSDCTLCTINYYIYHTLHSGVIFTVIFNRILLHVRSTCFLASTLKNATLSYFIISKSYFINYTIPFYNTPYIQKLYYFTFSLKYYFCNLSLLFLSYHHFFSVKGWNKKYIYFLA